MKNENKEIQKIRRRLQSPMQRQAYARAIRYISCLIAVMLAISPQIQKIANVGYVGNPVYAVYDGISDIITSSEDNDIEETQESNQETMALTTPTTIVVPVTSVTTTTTVITTTSVVTTEEPTEPTTEEVVEETEEYYYEEEDVYEEEEYDYYEEEYVEEDTYSDESYSAGYYTAKFYEGSVGSYGYSGRDLVSGYSVASPDFPQGTLLYITGGGLDGTYRVDDTGCPSGVIDFFFFYGDTPSHFAYNGVYSIEVSVVG